MRHFFLTLVLSLFSVVAWADDALQSCVIVEFQNGETMAVALSHKPKVTFDSDDVVFTAETFEGRYARTDIHRFYFEMQTDGIKTIAAAEHPSSGDIYDANGRKVGHYDGTLNENSLPLGVYIIKTTSGQSFKVLKK